MQHQKQVKDENLAAPTSEGYDPESEVERLREALIEVRYATTFDNCCGQLRKIEKIVTAALHPDEEPS